MNGHKSKYNPGIWGLDPKGNAMEETHPLQGDYSHALLAEEKFCAVQLVSFVE